MRLTRVNITLISIICMCILALSLTMGLGNIAYAEDKINLEDGRYEVSFDTSMPAMGMGAFENKAKKVILEKVGKKYYITISTDATQVSDVALIMAAGKPGETLVVDGNIERHTYSIEEKFVGKELELSMFVKAMNRESRPKITPNLATAKRLGDVDVEKDRPAEYVPIIETTASDSELEKGSTYNIREATASIGSWGLTVLTKAYYVHKGEPQMLDIESGSILLDRAGEYHVIYHAESDKYKTLKGENTVTEIDVKIIAKVGATSIVKIEDNNGILPANYGLQSNIITSGEIFDKATLAMKKLSDNFEVIDFSIIDETGDVVIPSDSLEVSLRCNDAYNKREVEVYYMSEDGKIEKLASENFGRYVKVNTKNAGTYIVCQPGVAFHMPMWGIASLTILGVVILVVAIVVPIVVVSKKKRAMKSFAMEEDKGVEEIADAGNDESKESSEDTVEEVSKDAIEITNEEQEEVIDETHDDINENK